jgi:hypothetical protein
MTIAFPEQLSIISAPPVHILVNRPLMKQKRHADLKLDGRDARSEHSREAVVQAVVAFVREGIPRPTARSRFDAETRHGAGSPRARQ